MGPRDLLALGTGITLFGFVLLTGLFGTAPVIASVASFLITGGVVAVMFAIPWLVAARLLG